MGGGPSSPPSWRTILPSPTPRPYLAHFSGCTVDARKEPAWPRSLVEETRHLCIR